jgi:hypothetical protein
MAKEASASAATANAAAIAAFRVDFDDASLLDLRAA